MSKSPQKEKAILHNQRFQYHTESSHPNDDVCSRLAVQIKGKGILKKNPYDYNVPNCDEKTSGTIAL